MSAIAARYARAFADVVFDAKLDAAKTVAETESLVAAAQSSPALMSAWDNPGISLESKLKVLDGIAAQTGIQRQTRNFLAVLIQQRRAGILPEAVKMFKSEINDRLGFAEAEVVGTRALGDDERKKLESEVERMAGKKLRATYSTDASLLGGAVVKMGSTVYDGSVRGRLERLKKQMSAD